MKESYNFADGNFVTPRIRAGETSRGIFSRVSSAARLSARPSVRRRSIVVGVHGFASAKATTCGGEKAAKLQGRERKREKAGRWKEGCAGNDVRDNSIPCDAADNARLSAVRGGGVHQRAPITASATDRGGGSDGARLNRRTRATRRREKRDAIDPRQDRRIDRSRLSWVRRSNRIAINNSSFRNINELVDIFDEFKKN